MCVMCIHTHPPLPPNLCTHLHPLQTGDKIKLTWTFRGIGEDTCTHDGVAVDCTSPHTLIAQDVSTEDKKHDFVVTFTDICGNEEVAKFSYTQKGVVTESKPNVPDNITGGGEGLKPGNNSATATARSAVSVMASAAAAMVLLPVLL